MPITDRKYVRKSAKSVSSSFEIPACACLPVGRVGRCEIRRTYKISSEFSNYKILKNGLKVRKRKKDASISTRQVGKNDTDRAGTGGSAFTGTGDCVRNRDIPLL